MASLVRTLSLGIVLLWSATATAKGPMGMLGRPGASRPKQVEPVAAPVVRVVSDAQVRASLNAPLAKDFPRLHPVLSDPDAFFATMSQRFDRQRRITPNDPYQFDYSEIGMPLVKDMRSSLGKRRDELAANQAIPAREREIAAQHLQELSAQADGYIKHGSISYRTLIEFSHFYTRAVGQFDKRGFSLHDREFLKFDEHLQGFAGRGAEAEYADYRLNRFSLFQKDKKSGNDSFKEAEGPFVDAVWNPHALQTLLVPTNEPLSQHLLMRLANRNISIVGVSSDAVLADGFRRPPGLFWVHDLRHQSDQFYRRQVYLREHGISGGDVESYNRLLDRFYYELHEEVSALPEGALKEALKLSTFNFHFDRGYPMMPSAFLDHRKDAITLGLYVAEKFGGQGVKFKAPIRNLSHAHDWLEAFWQKRAPVEAQFLASLKH